MKIKKTTVFAFAAALVMAGCLTEPCELSKDKPGPPKEGPHDVSNYRNGNFRSVTYTYSCTHWTRYWSVSYYKDEGM